MKKYILYGTGIEGEKFIYQHLDIVEQIIYCIDKSHEGYFHGIPIKQIEDAFDCMKYKILVASVFDTYKKIKQILEQRGCIEFEHFIWTPFFKKQLAVINANCHGEAVSQYLMLSENFKKKYAIYPLPPIHLNQEKQIDMQVLKNADLYLHQDIRPQNQFSYKFSDEYTLPLLKKDCIQITIPNFVGMGGWEFWQQGTNTKYLETPYGLWTILHQDIVLDEAYHKGLDTIGEYIHYYEEYHISDANISARFEKDINKLTEREKQWDIKISDYIIRNLKKIPCFIDRDHPSRYVMREVGRRLTERIGIRDIDDENYDIQFGNPLPILNVIKNYFDMEFGECFELREPLKNRSSSLETYIRTYLWWYYDKVV